MSSKARVRPSWKANKRSKHYSPTEGAARQPNHKFMSIRQRQESTSTQADTSPGVLAQVAGTVADTAVSAVSQVTKTIKRTAKRAKEAVVG